jgi:chromate transporter
LAGALSAITAAVVGVVLNLALWFALHYLFRSVAEERLGPLSVDLPAWNSLDPAAAILSLLALAAVFLFRIGMLPVIAGSAAAGMLVQAML